MSDLECKVCDGGGTLTVPDSDGESASEQACPDPVHDGTVTATPGQAAYEGLSPYGIAVTALERILDLDAGWMSWDEARAIASEAATLAVAKSAAEQPAPELAAATVLAEVLDFLDGGIRPGDEFALQVAQWRKRGLPS